MDGKPACAEARMPNYIRLHCIEPCFLQPVCNEICYGYLPIPLQPTGRHEGKAIFEHIGGAPKAIWFDNI